MQISIETVDVTALFSIIEHKKVLSVYWRAPSFFT